MLLIDAYRQHVEEYTTEIAKDAQGSSFPATILGFTSPMDYVFFNRGKRPSLVTYLSVVLGLTSCAKFLFKQAVQFLQGNMEQLEKLSYFLCLRLDHFCAQFSLLYDLG